MSQKYGQITHFETLEMMNFLNSISAQALMCVKTEYPMVRPSKTD